MSPEFNYLKTAAVAAANEVRLQLGSDRDANFEIVMEHVQDGQVVFAVWKPWRENGGFLIVKGEALLEKIASGDVGEGMVVPVTAIPCGDADQAEAIRQSIESGQFDTMKGTVEML